MNKTSAKRKAGGKKDLSKEYLTKIEIATILDVHPNTIDNKRKQGLPYIKHGKHVQFVRADVIKWWKKTGGRNYPDSQSAA
jgi:hypothetical protein